MCTSVAKRTIDYYLKRGNYVFACFVDFQKAFDRVNYWKLFSQMLDDGGDACMVRLLAFSHSRQMREFPGSPGGLDWLELMIPQRTM